MNEITFEKLPEAVAVLIKQIGELRELVKRIEKPPEQKRLPIRIDEACSLVRMAKPTIYALVRKGLIPCYKTGKNLYFYEDELLDWITQGKKNIIAENDSKKLKLKKTKQ